jgi:hypothetical protein
VARPVSHAASPYPFPCNRASQAPSGARVRLKQDGVAEVEVAASDMGPGTYTSMTQVAAEMLGLAVEINHTIVVIRKQPHRSKAVDLFLLAKTRYRQTGLLSLGTITIRGKDV